MLFSFIYHLSNCHNVFVNVLDMLRLRCELFSQSLTLSGAVEFDL